MKCSRMNTCENGPGGATAANVVLAANVYAQVRFSDSGGVHRTLETGDELRGVEVIRSFAA